jgi:acyl-coenzyme A thioesterase PaaI-like protein
VPGTRSRLGIRVVEVRPGFARTEMTVESRHLNSIGILQGGALTAAAEEISRTRRL